MSKLLLALLASTAFIGVSRAQAVCSIVDVTYKNTRRALHCSLTTTKPTPPPDIHTPVQRSDKSHHTAPSTADVKAQLNYIVKTARPESGWSPELSMIPNFDFTASTSRSSD